MFQKKIFILLVVMAVFSSCKKDKNILGTDVMPGKDSLNALFTNSMSIYSFSKRFVGAPASLNTRYKFLGNNLDPIFGEMNVDLFTNVNTPFNELNFGDSAQLISSEIILVLDNVDFSGSFNSALSFSVYPLARPISKDSTYFLSSYQYSVSSNPISVYTASFTLFNGKRAIRLPIDNVYASDLMKDKNSLVDNITFQKKYFGFYITASRNSMGEVGIIYKCDLEDESCGFYLNYKTKPSDKEKIAFRFPFSGNTSVKFNTTKSILGGHTTDLVNQIYFNDSTAGGNNLFLMGLGFSRLKLNISELKSYADSFDISVNRAELILNVDFTKYPNSNDTLNRYLAPESISLLPLNANGEEIFPYDLLSTTGAARYDGNYDETNHRYVFNIARQVQAIFKGQVKNYGFSVFVSVPSINTAGLLDQSLRRVVFAGKNNLNLKPVLNLTYLKFKK